MLVETRGALVERPASVRSRRGLVAVFGAAVAISVAALAVTPLPQYDPYGWLLWGRELAGSSLGFSTMNYPSWKPFGAIVGVLAQLGGSAAPGLLLVIVRVLGLLGVAVAYRVASSAAGRVAGVAAALAIVVAPGWLADWLDGHLEPAVGAFLLLGVLLDSRGRRRSALAALAVAALARPEAFAPLVIYAVLVSRKHPELRRVALAWCLAVPAIWIGGDFAGSRIFDHGGALARASGAPGKGNIGAAALAAAGAAVPALAFAGVAWALVAWRQLERAPRLLAAFAASWACVDIAMTATGYPAAPRYLVPLAALTSVLGAIGLTRLIDEPETSRAARARKVVVAVLVGISAFPFVQGLRGEVAASRGYSNAVADLRNLLVSPSLARYEHCPMTVARPFETAAAWYMKRETSTVARVHSKGLLLVGPKVEWPRVRELMRGGDARPVVASEPGWSAHLVAVAPERRCPSSVSAG